MTARLVHWPEYLIEAAALGSFMVSACVFGTLLGAPGSPVVSAVPSPLVRRLVMGVLMGLTLIAIVHSSWGRRSGAQMNPAFTLTFFRLGRSAPHDAAGYIVAQFAGGLASSLAGVIVVQTADGHLQRYDVLGYVVVGAMAATIALMYPIHRAVMRKMAAAPQAPAPPAAVAAE